MYVIRFHFIRPPYFQQSNFKCILLVETKTLQNLKEKKKMRFHWLDLLQYENIGKYKKFNLKAFVERLRI